MGTESVTSGATLGGEDPLEAARQRLMGAERVIFFSDAVFAIAMTLLVLDLKLPDLGEHFTRQGFEAALRAHAPNFIAFVLSFCIIAMLWTTHHHRFETVEKIDGRGVTWSLVLLFFVALLPMPTALVMQPWAGSPWPIVLYAVNVGGAYFVLNMLWRHLFRAGLAGVPEAEYKARQLMTTTVWVLFLISLPVAFVDPRFAYLVWMLIAPANVIMSRYVRRRYGHG